MRKTILLAATALSAAAVAGAAAAQTQTQAQTQAQTQNQVGPATEVASVQVTARTLEDTLPQQLAQAGSKVEVVPGQAIRNGVYPDLGTALQTLAPSLYVLPKSGPFDYVDVSLLGSRSVYDVLWLVDGVRINNRLYANKSPLDTIPAGVVDHVELVDGGQSLFYGTQAIAGAVNIVTRPFTQALSGSAEVSLDTNTTRRLNAAVSGAAPLGQFVLYGSADRSEGYDAFREQDYQPSITDRRRAFQVYTGGVKYQVDLGEQLRIGGSYQRTQARLDAAFPYRISQDTNARSEDLATAKLDYQATERLGLFVKGYWHNMRTINDTAVTLPVVGFVPVYTDAFQGFHDYGINALGKYDVRPGVEAYFGYDWQKYGGRDDTLTIRQNEAQDHAGFAQLRLTPELIPHTTLAAGVRYTSPSYGQASTIWNLSGKYEAPSGLYVRGQGGTNFRLPSAEELFADDRLLAREKGNPDLKPERSIGGDLSVGLRTAVLGRPARLEVTGFMRDVSDLIDFTGVVRANQRLVGNVPGVVRTRGAALDASVSVIPSLGATFNYTYADTRDSSGKNYASNVPENLLKGSVDWHPANVPLGASASVVYAGTATAPLGSGTVSYGEYAVVDLSARWYMDAARHHVLNFSVRNLFDRQYGHPYAGCRDNLKDGLLGCGKPYQYVALGLPRTLAVSYRFSF